MINNSYSEGNDYQLLRDDNQNSNAEKEELRECVSFNYGKLRQSGHSSVAQVEDNGDCGMEVKPEHVEIERNTQIYEPPKQKVLMTSAGPAVPLDTPVIFRNMEDSVTFYVPVSKLDPSKQKEINRNIDSGNVEYLDASEKPKIVNYVIKETETPVCRNNVDAPAKTDAVMQMAMEEIAPGFGYLDGYTYYLQEDQDKVRLFKGRIEIPCIYTRQNRMGEIISVKWKIKIISSSDARTIEMNGEEAAAKITSKLRSVPGIQIGMAAGVEKCIRNLTNALAGYAKRITIYINSGWNYVDGRYRYLYDGRRLGIEIDCGNGMENQCVADPFRVWRMAMQVFNEQKLAGPVLLYALMGVTYFLFESANKRPTTILFISGETGSLKTALAKVFFRIFNLKEDEPIFSFQSTKASIEPNIEASKDQTFLIDDFCPNVVERGTGNAMGEMLDAVVRYYGDVAPKQKSNLSGGKVETPRPRGGAVITGEVPLKGKSSILRTVCLELVKGQISGEKLAVFQDNTGLWQGLIGSYILYLENHFDECVGMIQSRYQQLRKHVRTKEIKEARSVDHYVEYILLAELLGGFFLENGTSASDVEGVKANLISGVDFFIRQSESLSSDSDPNRILLMAVYRTLTRGEITLADSQGDYKQRSYCHGYCVDGSIYIEMDAFQKTVEKELQAQNMTLDKLGLTWRTAIQILMKRYKVIQEKANGNDSCSYTKITNSNGDRVKAYHIHLEVLAELVKEDS